MCVWMSCTPHKFKNLYVEKCRCAYFSRERLSKYVFANFYTPAKKKNHESTERRAKGNVLLAAV